MGSSSVNEIIELCSEYPFIFKFIAANDIGITNSHQSGIYMMRAFWPLFLKREGHKGENIDRHIDINWNNGVITKSRFIWYGKGTRSEYRLTRELHKIFKPEHIGSLLVILKKGEEEFFGYILDTDDEIEAFLSFFNLFRSRSKKNKDTGGFVSPVFGYQEVPLEKCFENEINNLLPVIGNVFPTTAIMSEYARKICSNCHYTGIPDEELLKWGDTEFRLFKKIEEKTVLERINQKFDSVDQFTAYANSVVNTRKSRAGHSLENHLSATFDKFNIPYSCNPVIEGKKKPDFIFPGVDSYNDESYPAEKLVFLGAKTTCKDRWRQVITEADRIPEKHLFTLQEGISEYQLDEMEEAKVLLVIPDSYRDCYPKNYKDTLINLNSFLEFLNDTVGNIPAQIR